jgi:SAM-dependent methyltransferase
MESSEFDKFAEEYESLLKSNIKLSGEEPEYFAEYKIKDVFEYVIKENFLTPNFKILDFGSGIGSSLPYFRKYFPDAEIIAIDVSERSLSLSQKRFPGMAKLQVFDGKKIPFAEGSFDLVFTSCVFHHIPPMEHLNLGQEIKRVLKQGGLFFNFEHNPLNPLTVNVVNACPYDENAILIPSRKWLRIMKEVGFHDVELNYRIFFPRILSFLRPLERFIKWLPLGAQYYICSKK